MQKLTWYTLPFPTDWATLFGAERPLMLEIGFGNGAYLVELARQNADCNIIGVEVSSQSLDKAERKMTRLGLDNARVIFGRGETLLHHMLTPASLREVHVNYPDPWFKSRHAERRLIQRDTVDAITSRLQVGGRLYLATDIRAYAEMSHEVLSQTQGLRNLLDAPWADSPPAQGRLTTTKYEAKGYAEGRTGHYFVYERTSEPAPFVPVLKELDMPHMRLSLPLSPAEVAERFEKLSFSEGEHHAAVMDAYINRRGHSILFEVTLMEPSIEQHVALVLYRREGAEYMLKFATLGYPRMTEGLHMVTRRLAEWLIGLHPEGQVLESAVRLARQESTSE